jgi:hypothetical protein
MQEDELECRICRCSSTPQTPLLTPCKCDGSIAPVHELCLRKWLETNGSQKCELCGYKYRWRPVFPPNTPTRLPRYELFAACLRYAAAIAPQTLHIIICFLVWIFCFPIMTSYLYRAFIHFPSFFAQEGGPRMLFATRLLSFRFLAQDWLAGFIILIFLVLCTFSNATLSEAIKIEAESITRRISYFTDLNASIVSQQSLNEEEVEEEGEGEEERENFVRPLLAAEALAQMNRRNNIQERNLQQRQQQRAGPPPPPPPPPAPAPLVFALNIQVHYVILLVFFYLMWYENTRYSAFLGLLLAISHFFVRPAIRPRFFNLIFYNLWVALLVISFYWLTYPNLSNQYISAAMVFILLLFSIRSAIIQAREGGVDIDQDEVANLQFQQGIAQGGQVANNAHAQALQVAAARARQIANEAAQDLNVDHLRALRAEEAIVQEALQKIETATFPELLPPDVRDPALARQVLDYIELGGDAFVPKSLIDTVRYGWKPFGGVFTVFVSLPIRGLGAMTCVSGFLNYMLLGTSDDVFSNPRLLAQLFSLFAVLIGIYLSEVRLKKEFPRGWMINASSEDMTGNKEQRAAASIVAAANGRPHVEPPLVNEQIELQTSLIRLRLRSAAYSGGLALIAALILFTISASLTSRLSIGAVYSFALYIDPNITHRFPGLEVRSRSSETIDVISHDIISDKAEVASAFMLDMWIGICSFFAGFVAAFLTLPLPERDIRAFKSLVEIRSSEVFTTRTREEDDMNVIPQPQPPLPPSFPPSSLEEIDEVPCPLMPASRHLETESLVTEQVDTSLDARVEAQDESLDQRQEWNENDQNRNFSFVSNAASIDVSNHLQESVIRDRNNVQIIEDDIVQEEEDNDGWTTVTRRRGIRSALQPTQPTLVPPTTEFTGTVNDEEDGTRVRRRRRRGGGRNNRNNDIGTANANVNVNVDPVLNPHHVPHLRRVRDHVQRGQPPRFNRLGRPVRNQQLQQRLQRNGRGRGERRGPNGPVLVAGDLDDDDDDGAFRVEMPFIEALGLRPPIMHLFLHALVGLLFVSLGLCFFIAMPILSSRSAFLFMKRVSNGYLAWLSFLFDFSALFWHQVPHPTDFVILESDLLFLVTAYISVLSLIVLGAILDDISRRVILFYLSMRTFYIHIWFRIQEVVHSISSRIFAIRSTTQASIISNNPSLFQRFETFLLPEYIRKIINENWPEQHVMGILTFSESTRSIMLLARLTFILVLRIVAIPILVGVAMGIAAMPGMRQLWIPESETVSQTAFEGSRLYDSSQATKCFCCTLASWLGSSWNSIYSLSSLTRSYSV